MKRKYLKWYVLAALVALAAVYLAQGYYNKKFYPADPAELNPHDTEYNC